MRRLEISRPEPTFSASWGGLMIVNNTLDADDGAPDASRLMRKAGARVESNEWRQSP
jgi:hypothetical protein